MLTEFVMIPIFFLISVFLFIRFKKEKSNVFVFMGQLVFLMYIFCLISVTFFDIPYQKELIRDYHKEGYGLAYNYIPFKSIKEIIEMNKENFSVILRQIGGNLILLCPLGVYVSVAYEKFANFKTFFVLIIGTAVSIEVLQFLVNTIITIQYRSVDVDDIILNVVGGCVGYMLHYMVKPFYKYAVSDEIRA